MLATLYIIGGAIGLIVGWAVIWAMLGWLRGRESGLADEERAFREHYDARERRSRDGCTLPPVK